MTREELLAALQLERYDNRWWSTVWRSPREWPAVDDDSEATCARRRHAAAEDFAESEQLARRARMAQRRAAA